MTPLAGGSKRVKQGGPSRAGTRSMPPPPGHTHRERQHTSQDTTKLPPRKPPKPYPESPLRGSRTWIRYTYTNYYDEYRFLMFRDGFRMTVSSRRRWASSGPERLGNLDGFHPPGFRWVTPARRCPARFGGG